ncbi:N-acetylgalactosaminyltransferase 7 [Galemys pyrenaicus]|uniref:N-acetylgalactosaminyltransferase 7 n=1 Tax=Galemys pyrenaicus TaxID=202257 RepID=A0A8J6A3I1_GALPY|nr:N-acetylgalactosaminyltransferase 7 [Galemys pyrenaicus]
MHVVEFERKPEEHIVSAVRSPLSTVAFQALLCCVVPSSCLVVPPSPLRSWSCRPGWTATVRLTAYWFSHSSSSCTSSISERRRPYRPGLSAQVYTLLRVGVYVRTVLQEDRDVNNPMPNRGGNGLAPGEDRLKPVVPWPHVEGVEVDLESIRRKNKAKNEQARHAGGDNQKDIMQRQYLTFKPQTFTYRDPVLRLGSLGNFEPKEPEPQGVVGGPGEKAKPLVLGPEFKHAVQASIKEFGFNMVASDMISLDRSVNDLRQEECAHLRMPTLECSQHRRCPSSAVGGWKDLINLYPTVWRIVLTQELPRPSRPAAVLPRAEQNWLSRFPEGVAGRDTLAGKRARCCVPGL